jgi:hypothetical protein
VASNEEIKAVAASRGDLAGLGADGYAIETNAANNEIHILGQSDSGVVAGVGRLMREMRYLPGIGAEGYRIEDRQGGGVRILGNDPRGLVAGTGKFLRSSRYDQGGFTAGTWRGASVPQKPHRGIYFATHFHTCMRHSRGAGSAPRR